MGTQLLLKEPRNVLSEPGLGLNFDFGVGREDTKKVLRDGFLRTTGLWYSPIGRHFLGTPDFAPTQLLTSTAFTEIGTWKDSGNLMLPTGEAAPYRATSSATWKLAEKADAPAGQGRFVFLIAYETKADQGGKGTNSPVTLYFGGVWRCELFDTGSATLSEQVTTTTTDPNTGDPVTTTAWVPRRQFDWMTAQHFAAKPWTPHWLWVYEAGPQLVIANLSPSLAGKYAGVSYVDPGAVADADDPARKHALRKAPWRIEGGGSVALLLANQKFVAGEGKLTAQSTSLGDFGSTMECYAAVHGTAQVDASTGNDPIEPVVTTTDETDQTYPQGTDSFAPDHRYAIGWEVTFTSTATETYFLSGVTVTVPPVYRSDGSTGTDVIALANVADKRIDLQREGDLTREQLSATFQTYKTDLAAWCQPNMAVRYVVGGVTRFRGLTSGASWRVLADTVPPTGELSLQAEGLWRRFRKALWPGGKPFDGRLLTECLTEVLEAAGLTAGDYELTSWPYRFPVPEPGQPPALVYRPGDSLDRILEDLQAKWYGTSLVHYFRLSDGKFVLAPTRTTGTPAAYFYQTSALAAAAGKPGQTIRDGSYTESLDDAELYNVVAVLGQTKDGQPLVARCVDWDSIRNRSARNYVGEVWPLVVSDPGLATQTAVNWACRSLFEQHRDPRVRAEWRSHRVDLFPGDLVQLVGDNYWGTYRLTGIRLSAAAEGAEADPMGLATYQAEKLL